MDQEPKLFDRLHGKDKTIDLSGYRYPDVPMVNAHCDSRVLHRPGDCNYCDAYPEVQRWRVDHNVAFTGHLLPGQHPCPADAARPPGSSSDHRTWGGNRPTNVKPLELPLERVDSQMMYGPTQLRYDEHHPDELAGEYENVYYAIKDGSLEIEDDVA